MACDERNSTFLRDKSRLSASLSPPEQSKLVGERGVVLEQSDNTIAAIHVSQSPIRVEMLRGDPEQHLVMLLACHTTKELETRRQSEVSSLGED
jgi:hypothetical protein